MIKVIFLVTIVIGVAAAKSHFYDQRSDGSDNKTVANC